MGKNVVVTRFAIIEACANPICPANSWARKCFWPRLPCSSPLLLFILFPVFNYRPKMSSLLFQRQYSVLQRATHEISSFASDETNLFVSGISAGSFLNTLRSYRKVVRHSIIIIIESKGIRFAKKSCFSHIFPLQLYFRHFVPLSIYN